MTNPNATKNDAKCFGFDRRLSFDRCVALVAMSSILPSRPIDTIQGMLPIQSIPTTAIEPMNVRCQRKVLSSKSPTIQILLSK